VYDAVALLPDAYQGRSRTPFTFGADFIAIPASGSLTVNVKISDDADFVLTMQTAVLTNDAAQSVFVAQLPLTVTIVESGSGRQTMNQPIHISAMFGNIDPGPLVLPQPQILVRSSTYQVTLQNLTATANMSARLAFWGFKMYGPLLAPGSF
jgi:hypothetical protein